MSFGELMNWIYTSTDVTSLLLAIEAVLTWASDDGRMFFNTRNKVNIDVMEVALMKLIYQRNWPLLPEYFLNYANVIPRENAIREEMFVKFNWMPYCFTKTRNKQCKYVIIKGITNSSDPMALLTGLDNDIGQTQLDLMAWLRKRDGKIVIPFHFKHPQVVKCKQQGDCGFILELVSDEADLFKMRLCYEKADYKSQSVHFHDEVRAEKMHVYLSNDNEFTRKLFGMEDALVPFSWLSKTQLNLMNAFKQFHICSSFRVLYSLD